MYVTVFVTPGARKERVTKENEVSFVIAVKEPAERNMANKRAQTLLAEVFDTLPTHVRLVAGHRSRKKVFDVNL